MCDIFIKIKTFNGGGKTSLKLGVIPKYAQIKVPYTSPASKVTQRKVQLSRVKEEIKYLYMKKEKLNESLYKLVLPPPLIVFILMKISHTHMCDFYQMYIVWFIPYANEWLLCKHYWDPIRVHSPLRLEIY